MISKQPLSWFFPGTSCHNKLQSLKREIVLYHMIRRTSFFSAIEMLAILLVLLVVGVDSQLRGAQELLLDPKTVTQKGPPHEDYSELRFLFFGTSRTRGSGIINKPLFPNIVSPTATNLAISASTSLYTSHCTASMLKETTGAFDVIDHVVRKGALQ
jgi:hypothetical protein